MSLKLDVQNFVEAQALMAVGVKLENDHSVLEKILEESGYTDCEFEDIDDITFTAGGRGLKLEIDFNFFNPDAEPEEDGTVLNSQGTVYIRYEDGKLVAEF